MKDSKGSFNEIELLQNAAKAAGYKLDIFEGRTCIKLSDTSSSEKWYPWNTLQNDGDAFRLANDLQLCISIGRLDGIVTVTSANNSSIYCSEIYLPGEPSYKATRHAITRAAEAIAKAERGAA